MSAKRGKVKGTATVKPATDQEAAGSGTPVAPDAKPGEGQGEYEAAFDAGALASKRGTPSRPPLDYSDLEVKGWYAGYKSHANPQSGGPVEDIPEGYRGDY